MAKPIKLPNTIIMARGYRRRCTRGWETLNENLAWCPDGRLWGTRERTVWDDPYYLANSGRVTPSGSWR